MKYYVEIFAKQNETAKSSMRFTYDIEASSKEEAKIRALELHKINVLFPVVEEERTAIFTTRI